MRKCACGCGADVKNQWVKGHHWRVRREAQGITDTKVCGHCARTYSRDELEHRQSNVHWLTRRYCSEECRVAARVALAEEPKECPRCHVVKPRSEFSGLLAAYCRPCSREWRAERPPVPWEVQKARNLRQFYGMTLDQFEALIEQQAGGCAICGKPETAVHHRTGKAKTLAVDHDHDTGDIRGLLCTPCNQAIGKFQHDPSLLAAAIDYLARDPAIPLADLMKRPVNRAA